MAISFFLVFPPCPLFTQVSLCWTISHPGTLSLSWCFILDVLDLDLCSPRVVYFFVCFLSLVSYPCRVLELCLLLCFALQSSFQISVVERLCGSGLICVVASTSFIHIFFTSYNLVTLIVHTLISLCLCFVHTTSIACQTGAALFAFAKRGGGRHPSCPCHLTSVT